MNYSNRINCRNDQIDLNAVKEMKFESLGQSEFFVAYKSLYSFEWTELITLYIIAEALCFLWENFIILVIINLFLYLYTLDIRRLIILKIKTYCLGLVPQPEFGKIDKCVCYYIKSLELLELILLPVFIYKVVVIN